MLLLALARTAAPAAADWREFDRRRRGWDETPAEYDAAGLRRHGGRILVWIRYEVRVSGLPDLAGLEDASASIRVDRLGKMPFLLRWRG